MFCLSFAVYFEDLTLIRSFNQHHPFIILQLSCSINYRVKHLDCNNGLIGPTYPHISYDSLKQPTQCCTIFFDSTFHFVFDNHKNQSACRRQVKWNCFSEETFVKNNADFKFTDTATSGTLFHKYSVTLSTVYLDLA